MVVGQHGRDSTARAQPDLGQREVVRRGHLEVVGRGLDDDDARRRRARRATRRRWPAASTSSAHVERARAATAARNACGVWIAHRRERSCVRTTTPSGPASLTVSVTRAAAIAASASGERVERAREQRGIGQRARGVVDGDGVDVAGRGERVAHRGRARRAALDEHEAEREVAAPRRRAPPRPRRRARAGRRRRRAGRRPRRSRRATRRPSGGRRGRRTPSAGRRRGARRCPPRRRSRRSGAASAPTHEPWATWDRGSCVEAGGSC